MKETKRIVLAVALTAVALCVVETAMACDDKYKSSSAPVVVAPNTGKTHQVITDKGSYLVMPSYSGNTTYVIQTGKVKK